MNRRETIAAYALGELAGSELASFERRLAADPELLAEVEAMRGTIAHLETLPGDAWPRVEPPAGDAPAPRPAAVPSLDSDRRPRHRLALRPAVVAAIVLAGAVLGGAIGTLIASDGGPSSSSLPAKTVLVLRPLDAPKSSRADLSMPNPETMLLRARGLPPSAPGDYYEVWLMSSETKLVPVASFRVDKSGEASVEVPLPAAPDEYTYFDVSRQTVNGGTGHSGDSVLRGPTSALGA